LPAFCILKSEFCNPPDFSFPYRPALLRAIIKVGSVMPERRPPMDIVKFLKSNEVAFQLRHHPARFTAQEVAAAEHISGEDVAKTVVVRAGDRFAMFVLPATHVLEMAKVRKLLGDGGARLATEEEMEQLFPDTQVGAEPPFGLEYGLDTFVEENLADFGNILIPAGTHEDSILITWKDYERLARPKVAAFGSHTA
jgi:Ala-tRNA(Pro) deacylase